MAPRAHAACTRTGASRSRERFAERRDRTIVVEGAERPRRIASRNPRLLAERLEHGLERAGADRDECRRRLLARARQILFPRATIAGRRRAVNGRPVPQHRDERADGVHGAVAQLAQSASRARAHGRVGSGQIRDELARRPRFLASARLLRRAPPSLKGTVVSSAQRNREVRSMIEHSAWPRGLDSGLGFGFGFGFGFGVGLRVRTRVPRVLLSSASSASAMAAALRTLVSSSLRAAVIAGMALSSRISASAMSARLRTSTLLSVTAAIKGSTAATIADFAEGRSLPARGPAARNLSAPARAAAWPARRRARRAP